MVNPVNQQRAQPLHFQRAEGGPVLSIETARLIPVIDFLAQFDANPVLNSVVGEGNAQFRVLLSAYCAQDDASTVYVALVRESDPEAALVPQAVEIMEANPQALASNKIPYQGQVAFGENPREALERFNEALAHFNSVSLLQLLLSLVEQFEENPGEPGPGVEARDAYFLALAQQRGISVPQLRTKFDRVARLKEHFEELSQNAAEYKEQGRMIDEDYIQGQIADYTEKGLLEEEVREVLNYVNQHVN